MCVGDALRELAGFLDGCEEESLVNAVGLVERDAGEARELTAEAKLRIPTRGADGEPGVRLQSAHVDADGRLGFALESVEPVVPAPEGRVTVEPTDVVLGSDGAVEVTITASVPTDDRSTSDRDTEPGTEPGIDPRTEPERSNDTEPTTDGGPGGAGSRNVEASSDQSRATTAGSRRDRDVPPFRDPELLAEVYESCDTFAEMTDAIGMDVTAETVRRYMIDYGIHQPNSYNTDRDTESSPEEQAGDPNDEGSPVLLADGIGLPDDVTVETLIETVERSNTLYEVERDIGVDREDALDMLRQLNLLDLVVGRLSTEHERDIDREDVVDRLRQASAAG